MTDQAGQDFELASAGSRGDECSRKNCEIKFSIKFNSMQQFYGAVMNTLGAQNYSGWVQ